MPNTTDRHPSAQVPDAPPAAGASAPRSLQALASLDWKALVALADEQAKIGNRAFARDGFETALWRLVEAPATDGHRNPAGRHAAALCRWIARSFEVDGRHEEALDCIEASEAIALASEDPLAFGHAVNVRAIVHWQRGDLTEAQRLYSQCLDIALRESDTLLAATAAQNLGIVATVRGDHDQALHHFKASLQGYRSLGASREMYTVQNNLGRLYCDLARWDDAEAAFDSALAIATTLGETSRATMIEVNIAEMWVARREFDRAQASCENAIERAREAGDSHADGEAQRVMGIIARERRDFEAAEEALALADQIAQAREDVLLQAHVARERAELARQQGRVSEVLLHLTRARSLFGRLRAQRSMDDIERLSRRLEVDFMQVVQHWGESVEEKDRYTQGHCERVAQLSCTLAERCGVDAAAMFWFRVGAILHDVGKVGIDAAILNKADRLTADEWVLIKQHTIAGVELLADVGLPEDVIHIIRSHHENWDGSGYPDGLRGERIPLWARIVCVADVYDALTSERSYKRALSHADAMEVMRRDVGRQFDPAVFHLFEELSGAAPPSLRPRGATGEANGASAAPGVPGGERGRIPTTPSESPETRITPSASLAASAAPKDDLTGLPLRKAFLATAQHALEVAMASGDVISLLVIDVDHFKLVNDTYGHLQGDDVLRAVATGLEGGVRLGDVVGRYAGDEFVVLLPATSHDDALEIAERLRTTIEGSRLVVRDRIEETLGVTLSIGVATSGTQMTTVDELFAAADRGLYAAKKRGRNAVGSALEAIDEGGTPTLDFERFVGRTRELRQLIRGLELAASGKPRLIEVVGEAGVGKSTLVRQLRPEARLRGAAMVAGRFIEADVKPPYGPWAEIIEAVHKLGLVPPRPWPELGRLVPSIDQGGGDPSVGSKYALLAEMAEYLRLATRRAPLIVVLDDVQWGDASSWDALEFILQKLDDERLLICLTTRVEDTHLVAERRRRLSRDERTSELQLQRLTLAELRTWIETVFHQGSVGEAFPRFLHQYTEGNPLLVVHVLRSLVEDGAVWYAGRRWQWNDAPELRLPTAVADLIAARVARLSDDARKHLALAAVVGRSFDVDVVLAAGNIDEDDFLDAVDEAITAKVVDEAAGGQGDQYSFSHGLIAQAMRASLNQRRLARAHEHVASALERLRPNAVADIAAHYDAAGVSDKAFQFALLAADRAAAVYAHNEAAASFSVAQRHAPTVEQRLETRLRQAAALELAGRYDEGVTLCDLILAEEISSGAREGLIAVRRQRERLRLLLGQSLAVASASVEALLHEATATGQNTEVILLLGMLSRICLRTGEPETGLAYARQAVDRAEEEGDDRLLADTLVHLGTASLESDAEASVRSYRRALDTFEFHGDLVAQARIHVNLGIALSQLRKADASRLHYEAALALGRRTRTPDMVGLASLNLAVLLMRLGHFAEAESHLTEAMQEFLVVRNELHRLAALYNLANLSREREQQKRAAELYGEAAVVATSIGQSDVEIGARSGQGLCYLVLGRIDEAKACLRTAEVLFSSRPSWWFQGRELLMALRIRTALLENKVVVAERLFRESLDLAERHDLYASAWLVAEVAPDLIQAGYAEVREDVERFRAQLARLDFVPLTARYERLKLEPHEAPDPTPASVA
ncbi:MAG TPA: diguanylate cyclase [Gemmatimonadaceae bacterium]|nr:diguanylate cyclase [Gemmatimonadaceae bacterium]